MFLRPCRPSVSEKVLIGEDDANGIRPPRRTSKTSTFFNQLGKYSTFLKLSHNIGHENVDFSSEGSSKTLITSKSSFHQMSSFTGKIRVGTDAGVIVVHENVDISSEGLSKTPVASKIRFSAKTQFFIENHHSYAGINMKSSFSGGVRFRVRRPLNSYVLRT